jgi:protein-S-isoprenylcysteine O-methyltransferase Ste14
MADQEDNPGVIAPPPVIAAAALLLGLGLQWLFPTRIIAALAGPAIRMGLGIALVIAGASMGYSAERAFRRIGTNVPPWRPALVLATDGIYGRIRNPMYAGLVLMVCGFAVGLAADWLLAVVIPMALLLHFGVVRREERYLAAKFGAPYRDYLARVPRYGLPPVKRR